MSRRGIIAAIAALAAIALVLILAVPRAPAPPPAPIVVPIPPAPALEPEPVPELPPEIAKPPELPAWRRYAAAANAPAGWPMVALVIDDVGLSRKAAARATALPAPVTLAFLPYADRLGEMTRAARTAGHELLLHLPMAPLGDENPGPQALLTTLDDAELLRRLEWNLARMAGYVGVNNHMGSRFTADPDGMAAILPALHKRGLLWLDSRTSADSIGDAMAQRIGMPGLARDVFLDNEISAEAVAGQLELLEQTARRKGYAIGIGHPHDATLLALESWIPAAQADGLALVPVSAIALRLAD